MTGAVDRAINCPDPEVDVSDVHPRLPARFAEITRLLAANGFGVGIARCSQGGGFFAATGFTDDWRLCEVDLDLLLAAQEHWGFEPVTFLREEIAAFVTPDKAVL